MSELDEITEKEQAACGCATEEQVGCACVMETTDATAPADAKPC